MTRLASAPASPRAGAEHVSAEAPHLHAPCSYSSTLASRIAAWDGCHDSAATEAEPRVRVRARHAGSRPKSWPNGSCLPSIGKMRWLPSILLLVSLSSCLQIGKGTDSDAGAEPGSAGSSSAGSSGASVTGTNCGVDPSSGIALCLSISACPSVRVDPAQFPDCGYRIAGAKIDLECLCGDSLCPMGSAASCLDAKALLFEQSAQGVCAGVADGRCQLVKQTPQSSTSTCDKDCRAQCSGVPGCINLCGC